MGSRGFTLPLTVLVTITRGAIQGLESCLWYLLVPLQGILWSNDVHWNFYRLNFLEQEPGKAHVPANSVL